MQLVPGWDLPDGIRSALTLQPRSEAFKVTVGTALQHVGCIVRFAALLDMDTLHIQASVLSEVRTDGKLCFIPMAASYSSR